METLKLLGIIFLVVESGGHILMGQKEKVRSEVTTFLKKYLATEAEEGGV